MEVVPVIQDMEESTVTLTVEQGSMVQTVIKLVSVKTVPHVTKSLANVFARMDSEVMIAQRNVILVRMAQIVNFAHV
jgi:hypothetical protein